MRTPIGPGANGADCKLLTAYNNNVTNGYVAPNLNLSRAGGKQSLAKNEKIDGSSLSRYFIVERSRENNSVLFQER